MGGRGYRGATRTGGGKGECFPADLVCHWLVKAVRDIDVGIYHLRLLTSHAAGWLGGTAHCPSFIPTHQGQAGSPAPRVNQVGG